MYVSIGADPEFFLANRRGEIISAHGTIPGTKAKPYSVGFNAAIQVDGMALEVNVPPAGGAKDFSDNCLFTLAQLQRRLPSGHQYVVKSWHDFGDETIAAQPAEARELGCDPDYNAWTGRLNPAPDAKSSIRTTSGHVHIGWTENEVPDDWYMYLCCNFAKHLDCILGLYSVLEDTDTVRKQLYGQAGAFRPKEYGIEYRVLSNYWLKNIDMMRKIWKRAYRAFRHYEKNIKYINYLRHYALTTGEVRGLINAEIPLTSFRAAKIKGYLKKIGEL